MLFFLFTPKELISSSALIIENLWQKAFVSSGRRTSGILLSLSAGREAGHDGAVKYKSDASWLLSWQQLQIVKLIHRQVLNAGLSAESEP